MDSVIKSALDRSYSYAAYRSIVTDLLAQGKSSGSVQSEELTHYSMLNETRMNRLEKTMVVPTEISKSLQIIRGEYTWLVLSEGWCGDAAQILPILYKMAESVSNIDLRIVFRDENPALTDAFLTNGARSIPKLIVLNQNKNVVATWGPRPKAAAELILNYKNRHGVVDQTAKTELQLWYLHDKGLSTQQEIVEIISKAAN